MIVAWLGGLLRRRTGRLLATVAGIAVSVCLVASLGAFLTASKSQMTHRAQQAVAVDWQVEVQPGASAHAVLSQVRADSGTKTALPVGYARTTAFSSSSGGASQRTGAGMLLGLPNGYQKAFPGEIRRLTGSPTGVLLAQQTAANLHAAPGDTVQVRLPGTGRAVSVHIDGVVELPQADSLFQKVGAPPQAQPAAPPDNVLLMPSRQFAALVKKAAAADPSAVTTQIHVNRDAPLPADPSGAYQSVTHAAHNLEARASGGALVGDNLGAALGAAREDALYAQILFLFLGLPGAVLAAVLTAAVTGAGAERRRGEQALLRLRGLRPRQVLGLAALEAGTVGLAGGLLGIGAAAVLGQTAFGTAAFGATGLSAALWFGAAVVVGLAVAASAVLVPALRELRSSTVADARRSASTHRSPWWMRYCLDFALIAISLLVFWASSGDQYALVLAPEGVPRISVSYWAFFGPALLWGGAALLLWRLATLALTHGRRVLGRLNRPLTGNLSGMAAALLTRRRRPLARSVVVLALALAFAASTATFNATYAQQAEADAQLTNGADVAVTEPPGAHVGPKPASRLHVQGVRHVEPLQHRFAYVGSDLQDLYGVRPHSITSATSLQDSYFAGGTAQQLMDKLAKHPDSLLLSAETVRDFQLKPGDTVKLRIQDGRTHRLRTVPFHYAGVVKEFPTAPSDSFFVANASYVAKVTGSDAVGTFLVDTGGTHQKAVADRLRHTVGTNAQVTDITQTRSKVGTSLTSVDLSGLTRIELVFAILLAAGAGGLVLALGLAERRRTFAIATVLGAKRRQLRGLVLGEAALVTAGGLIGGGVIGWVLSQMLVKVLSGVFDPPPAALAVPWPYLALAVLTSVAAVAGAALNGARRSRRPAVEELRDL
ncbi:ABC transporter permease [Streptomyces montanisoli]|uniref:ABC transporter permease n=1 Tax=Streptomyces montanisoli TaxID=2798581 RepID=A0A940RVS8_9ACTN|nr:ABC transporter permease [Streptomyces montanisoli]MBP0458556.1 ABC transporter permease [Streptomyces montanisoli]